MGIYGSDDGSSPQGPCLCSEPLDNNVNGTNATRYDTVGRSDITPLRFA